MKYGNIFLGSKGCTLNPTVIISLLFIRTLRIFHIFRMFLNFKLLGQSYTSSIIIVLIVFVLCPSVFVLLLRKCKYKNNNKKCKHLHLKRNNHNITKFTLQQNILLTNVHKSTCLQLILFKLFCFWFFY